MWSSARLRVFSGNLQLSTLDGHNGFKLSGGATDDRAGFSVSGAGDVNGDGFDDIIIGAPYADPHDSNSGAAYVLFGKSSRFAANIDLSTLDGQNGFKISGVRFHDHTAFSVGDAGDVNGDGFDDVLVGVPNGASYVIFGKAADFAANLDLTALDGMNGFKLSGAKGDRSGRSVSGAGDVNGDGFADVIIGAPRVSTYARYSGGAYVVLGKAGGFAANLELATLDGINGYVLIGAAEEDFTGYSVAGAGDINGDGFADVIIATTRFTIPDRPGSSYVAFGKAAGVGANLDLSSLDGTNGFTIRGASQRDRPGTFVSGAGDINGDGFADLIVGESSADPHGYLSGAAYVVFGRADAFSSTLELSALDPDEGFKLKGVAYLDQAGASVSTAGDVNGDGMADLIVGAPGVDSNGNSSGAAYVVFGGGATTDGIPTTTTDGIRRGTLTSHSVAGLIATIASIKVKGTASGSSEMGNFYGVTAESIGRARIHGLKLAPTTGVNNLPLDGMDEDFRLVEVEAQPANRLASLIGGR
jgi:hypothetical protein